MTTTGQQTVATFSFRACRTSAGPTALPTAESDERYGRAPAERSVVRLQLRAALLKNGGVFLVLPERKKKNSPPGGGGGRPPPLSILTIDTWAPVQCISDFMRPRARELHRMRASALHQQNHEPHSQGLILTMRSLVHLYKVSATSLDHMCASASYFAHMCKTAYVRSHRP